MADYSPRQGLLTPGPQLDSSDVNAALPRSSAESRGIQKEFSMVEDWW